MSKLSALARRELIRAARDRYLTSSPSEKRTLLDELVALTGYHRKHTIRVLRSSSPEPVSSSSRSRVYDEAVRDALVVLWEASNRICGKRLKPLLPVLVPALENHGHLSLDAAVRDRVLAASAATIDRLLSGKRSSAPVQRRNQRPPSPAARRTPAPASVGAEPTEPGYLRFDVVAHDGGHLAESCARTLVLTDLASGWIECAALRASEGKLVIDSLERLRAAMPFRLRGIGNVKGSEFIAETERSPGHRAKPEAPESDVRGGRMKYGLLGDAVLAYCSKLQIEVTRSRPQRPDDRAWVDRQSGSVVRRLVGDGRLEGPRAVEALERLYATARLYLNYFQPSFRLADKQRVGARVSKWYRSPETPCARLLASPFIDETTKQKLRTVLGGLDPRRLLDEIRAAQFHLAGVSTGEPPCVRPPQQAAPEPPRHWRTRPDPFEAVWPRVATWLELEPDRTAKELLQRLRDEDLGDFPDQQLRTLQRRVKQWRRTSKLARSS